MMKVGCLNNISSLGLHLFTSQYQLIDQPELANLLLVRSFKMHDWNISEDLIAVARAGAGVNNIPLDAMADKGVVVFNTPGANANGVKELVIAGMLLASRDIVGGITWVKNHLDDEQIIKSIEKAKKAFAGEEIMGKTILVIGLGAIGGMVANACSDLGLNVLGYDPYLSEKAAKALKPGIEVIHNVEKGYPKADFISLHLPLLDSTRDMIDETICKQFKDGVVLLNFSRDGLVKDSAIEEALTRRKVKTYVTDFPNHFVANLDHTIAIPHLGASTKESEDNCAIMAAKQLMAYVERGDIINAVNFPNITLGPIVGTTRLIILAKADDSVAKAIEHALRPLEKMMETSVAKYRKDVGVFAYDFDAEVPNQIIEALREVDGVLRVRLI